MLVGAVLLAPVHSGCPAPAPYGSLVASRGASTVPRSMATAVRHKNTTELLAWFTERCLRHCPGFAFSPTGRDGALHRFRWARRDSAGSLADDLHGQLHVYTSIQKARAHFTSLSFDGPRVARATLSLAVDGALKDGSLRSDRGTLQIALRQSADGSWRIDGFDPSDMRTTVATAPIFEDLSARLGELRKPAHPPVAVSDLAAAGTDLGPGLAIADVNGDGLLDLFLPGRGLGRLYLGAPKLGLRPGPPLSGATVTEYGSAAAFGDGDGDGDPDLLVLSPTGASRLLINDGRGSFQTSQALRLGPGRTAAWLDVDGDGRLDLLFSPAAPAGGATTLRLWMNTKTGFSAQPAQPPRLPTIRGRVVAACTVDLNRDGRSDVVLVDALGPVRVLLNRGGRFDVSEVGGTIMGRACSVGDLDGDGFLDVAIAAVYSRQAWKFSQQAFPLPGSPFRRPVALPSKLASATRGAFWLKSDGLGGVIRRALATPATLGWDVAIAVADVDADGRAEVALAGGFHPGPGQKRGQKRGQGGRLGRAQDDRFFTLTLPRQLLGRPHNALSSARGPLGATRGLTLLLGTGHGLADVGRPAGLETPSGVRAVAWADLDRDGTPELLLRRRDGSLRLWRLKQRRGKAITLRLLADGAVSTGATVTAVGLGHRATGCVTGGTGGHPAGEVTLGLADAARADRVEIRWPDGQRQVVQDLNTGAGYTIYKGREEPSAGLSGSPPPPRTTPPVKPPPPPAKPGVIAGIALSKLGSLPVRARPTDREPRALSAFMGQRATVLLIPPTPCKACPAYGRELAKLGRRYHRLGVRMIWLTSAAPGRPTPRGLTRLLVAPETTRGSLSKLLILGANGAPHTMYLGKLPDPLVLEHHLKRLTAP